MAFEFFGPATRMVGCSALLAFVSLVVGCGKGKPIASGANIDAAQITSQVFKAFDKNGDQKLSKDELVNCPGLMSSIDRFDQNKDGAISTEECQGKFSELERQGASLVAVTFVVRRNGVPVQGATVKLVPESFMGDQSKTASGVTDQDGSTVPSIPDEDIPSEYRGKIRGAPTGIFRVEVTHPSIPIPAKFNTQTTLGRIISRREHEDMVISL